jgi:glutamyl-tRNA reductase
MLTFVGLSHQRTPLALRERCAVPVAQRPQALAELRRRFGSAVLLSTCGRVELYLDGPEEPREAVRWLAGQGRVPEAELEPYVETAHDADAARRIVRVACGLESAVEGEDEILGQVRRAWLDAGAAGTLSPALDAAFRLAVRAGRQARRLGDPHAWTSLADSAATRVALAVEELAAPRVLVAGTGPMGLRAAQNLRTRLGETLELFLAGRTPERVAAHAAALGARPLTLTDVPAALSYADAAVVALRTPRTLFGPEHLAPRPAGRPLLIVDLSVPRAVDPAVEAQDGVRLLDVDGVAAGEGRPARWGPTERARVEAIAEEAVQAFCARAHRSDAEATLVALRLQAEGVRRTLLERTLRRLPELDEEARWRIDALTRALVNRLLHEPTLRLRTDADGTVARQVRALFFDHHHGAEGIDSV